MYISQRTGNGAKTQRGYTLLEILVAMVIGLFLLGGLLAIEQSNKTAFIGQDQLGKLRDSQRMALTMLNDVIQMAGYFPDPLNNVSTTVLAADAGNNLAAGQAITGATGDTITVRYATASGDTVLNCSGGSNTSGAIATYVNVFRIVGNQLVCTMNGTDYPLVGGTGANQINVQSMTILYGVKTNTAADNYNVDTYLTAAQVTAGSYWNSVTSVVVILTFNNPLYVTGQTGQLQTLQIQRVINIMNRTGVKI